MLPLGLLSAGVTLSIELLHFGAASLGFGHGGVFLLFSELLLLGDLVFGLDSGCNHDSVKVLLADDNGIGLALLSGLTADVAELIHRDHAGLGLDHACVFLVPKEGLIHLGSL